MKLWFYELICIIIPGRTVLHYLEQYLIHILLYFPHVIFQFVLGEKRISPLCYALIL
jgi:hypothetical protein